MNTILANLLLSKSPGRVRSCIGQASWTLLLAPIWAHAQTQVYTLTDGTFNPSSWALTVAWEFYPGTSTALFRHNPVGGNPGEFGSVSLQSSAPNAVALIWQNFTYNPATQGAILSVTSSADVRLLRNTGSDSSLPYRPLISQNGHFFYGNWAMGVTSSSWSPFTFAGNVLTASQFIGVGNANALKPDFSATGAPIQFGFMVDHGTLFSPRDSELGVDNWRFTITSVPEPGVHPFAALTLAAYAVNRRPRAR